MKTAILIFLCLNLSAHAAWIVKTQIKNGESKNLDTIFINKARHQRIKLYSIVANLSEDKNDLSNSIFEEWLLPQSEIVNFSSEESTYEFLGSEVRALYKQGEDSNRIVLTFLGDGYTEAERSKFFDDINRMVRDMFTSDTFKSFLPFFNIYAVFTPSRDSGISDLQSKSTAFGLYRSPRGSKRGIMPGNNRAIEAALKLINSYTDYPVIIANDDFYGGLGGRYAISTRSHNSGTMVLRHELGHNFSNVGEEYDGGGVYSGANFSYSANVPWAHWLQGTTRASVNEAKFISGSYLWQNLNGSAFQKKFTFPEGDYYFHIKVSNVGWETNQDVEVLLDGQPIDLYGVYTQDRSFLDSGYIRIQPGTHEVIIRENIKDANNVLAFANIYAFPTTYKFDNRIGAYNVFDSNQNQRGYRPTHNTCLMRDMRSRVFCVVDQENIWLRFLNKVNLIDELTVTNNIVNLKTPLDSISIRWFLDSKELTEYRNLKQWTNTKGLAGQLKVQVDLNTFEVRKKNNRTTTIKEVNL